METKYGTLEGQAARFNNVEAWWFVEDQWKWFALGASSNIIPMSEAEFKTHFPSLPPLPSKAFHSDLSLKRAAQ